MIAADAPGLFLGVVGALIVPDRALSPQQEEPPVALLAQEGVGLRVGSTVDVGVGGDHARLPLHNVAHVARSAGPVAAVVPLAQWVHFPAGVAVQVESIVAVRALAIHYCLAVGELVGGRLQGAESVGGELVAQVAGQASAIEGVELPAKGVGRRAGAVANKVAVDALGAGVVGVEFPAVDIGEEGGASHSADLVARVAGQAVPIATVVGLA